MPVRQMKEGSEQHIVIKPQLQTTINPLQKNPKTAQNGKGPPITEPQNNKIHNTTSSPPSRNRVRRRGRGGRKSDQGEAFMRPSSRPCTAASKPVIVAAENVLNVSVSSSSCQLVAAGSGFPSSSKSLCFAPRPGYGQLGTKCIVKANHFLAELPDKDLNQYDVSCYLFLMVLKLVSLSILQHYSKSCVLLLGPLN